MYSELSYLLLFMLTNHGFDIHYIIQERELRSLTIWPQSTWIQTLPLIPKSSIGYLFLIWVMNCITLAGIHAALAMEIRRPSDDFSSCLLSCKTLIRTCMDRVCTFAAWWCFSISSISHAFVSVFLFWLFPKNSSETTLVCHPVIEIHENVMETVVLWKIKIKIMQ